MEKTYNRTYLRMEEHEKYFSCPSHHINIWMEEYKYYIDDEYDSIDCYIYNSPLYIIIFALYTPIKLLTHGLIPLYRDWKDIFKPTKKLTYYRNPKFVPLDKAEKNEKSL